MSHNCQLFVDIDVSINRLKIPNFLKNFKVRPVYTFWTASIFPDLVTLKALNREAEKVAASDLPAVLETFSAFSSCIYRGSRSFHKTKV